MTVSNATKNRHIAALQNVIDNPKLWALLMDDDAKQERILDTPYLVEMFEDAVLAHDDAEYENRLQEEESERGDDLFDGLDDAVDDEPERGNFGMRMAALRKAKTQGKGKPAKKTAKKAEPRVFEFRAKHYKAHSVCKIVRGKEKGTSANTTAFERVCPDGEVIDRVIIGSTQAEIILSIPETERVKMLKSLQR
jgi:hypothetical protein